MRYFDIESDDLIFRVLPGSEELTEFPDLTKPLHASEVQKKKEHWIVFRWLAPRGGHLRGSHTDRHQARSRPGGGSRNCHSTSRHEGCDPTGICRRPQLLVVRRQRQAGNQCGLQIARVVERQVLLNGELK